MRFIPSRVPWPSRGIHHSVELETENYQLSALEQEIDKLPEAVRGCAERCLHENKNTHFDYGPDGCSDYFGRGLRSSRHGVVRYEDCGHSEGNDDGFSLCESACAALF